MIAKVGKNITQENITKNTYVDEVRDNVAFIYHMGMYHLVNLHVEYDDWIQNKVDCLNSCLTFEESDNKGGYSVSSFENNSSIEDLAYQFFMEENVTECTTDILTCDQYFNK